MSELIYISEFDTVKRDIVIDDNACEQPIETCIAFGQISIKKDELMLNEANSFKDIELSIQNIAYDLLFINDEDVMLSDNIILLNIKISSFDLIINFKISREILIYDDEEENE